MESHDNL
jgi:chromosome segregation ATPase